MSSVTFAVPAQGPQFTPLVQSIQLFNKFSVGVMVIAAELQDPYFRIHSFAHSQVIPPGATWVVSSLSSLFFLLFTTSSLSLRVFSHCRTGYECVLKASLKI
jgi:hypothetical protein